MKHPLVFVQRRVAAMVTCSLLTAVLVFGAIGGGVPALAQDGHSAPAAGAAIDMAHQLTTLLLAGELEEIVARFGPTMAGQLSADELGAVWASLPLQVGSLQDVGEPWIAGLEPFVFVRTPLHFEYVTLDLVYGFDAELLLGTLAFVPHEPQPEAGTGSTTAAAPGNVRPEQAASEGHDDAVVSVPPYANLDLFEEIELTFGLPQFPLPGTLTLPRGDGPFPAVVLVHGSGPQDRDETTGPNKPFRNLAWGLASRGIAVFRYDKRTLVHGAAMAVDPTMTVDDETIVDAVEAVRMLQERGDIAKIFIGGHSQGGMLAPYMALQEPSIDGLVLLAANARPIDTLIAEQFEYLLSIDVELDNEAMLRALLPDAQRLAARDFDGVDALLGIPVHYWIDFTSRDHVGVARELSQPMLILQGGRDYQVTVAEFELWQEELAGKPNVSFRLYPDLNHLFVPGEGEPSPMEYDIPGFVPEEVISDIANWIHAQN